MNYRKEQRNRRDITAEETKETKGFYMTTGHWKIWKIPREKKLASRLNNGKIWDFYSLQSNYGVSKRAHHKFYFL